MARRRLQQKGDLYRQGGWWKVRAKIDAQTGTGVKRVWGTPQIVGPAAGNPLGLPALTRKQAVREAWDHVLSRLDQNVRTPQSVVTVSQFIERKFNPEHVDLLRHSGRQHYKYMLKHVTAGLGRLQLREVHTDDVQRLVSELLHRGKSVQTARHVKNAVSAVFRHAETAGWHPGPNPARLVRLPEMVRRQPHALSFGQARTLVAALPSPERELVQVLLCTGMNVAEALGLRWAHVNLSSDQWAVADGDVLPPLQLAVREQWYRGHRGPLKARSRKRNLPLSSLLVDTLRGLRHRPKWTTPEDPVFCARSGRPIDEHNAMARHVKPVAEALKIPWLSWHSLRRTHATWVQQLGADPLDLAAMLGHGGTDLRMTARYVLPSQERRAGLLEELAQRLTGEPTGGVQ